MMVQVVNMGRDSIREKNDPRDVILDVRSLSANNRLITLLFNHGGEKNAKAALIGIGLRPSVTQDGLSFILQADQVHIKAGQVVEGS